MNSSKLLVRKINFNIGINGHFWSTARYSTQDVSKSDAIDITSADETPQFIEEISEEARFDLMKKRDKSKLNQPDRNRMSGKKPYNKSMLWIHDTVRFKQRTLGRYGVEALDVPAGVVWPTEEEIADKIDFERTAYPLSIQENWKLIAQENEAKEQKIRDREMEIASKMAMVSKWEKDLLAKIAKKEADLLAVKLKKERLIEEVRQQFGFKIDPRDERFKQVLEQKEKEDKKRKKEARKQEKSAKYMAQLMGRSQNTTPDAEKKVDNEKKS